MSYFIFEDGSICYDVIHYIVSFFFVRIILKIENNFDHISVKKKTKWAYVSASSSREKALKPPHRTEKHNYYCGAVLFVEKSEQICICKTKLCSIFLILFFIFGKYMTTITITEVEVLFLVHKTVKTSSCKINRQFSNSFFGIVLWKCIDVSSYLHISLPRNWRAEPSKIVAQNDRITLRSKSFYNKGLNIWHLFTILPMYSRKHRCVYNKKKTSGHECHLWIQTSSHHRDVNGLRN